MEYNYHGKTVVVTGAASGMGLAAATAFAVSGASVVMGDINADLGQQAADKLGDEGHDVIFLPTDVSCESDVCSLVETAVTHTDRLDVYVSAAGILGDRVKIDEQSEENLGRVFGVNVNGVVFGTKHAVPAMRRNGSGVIINYSSVQGFRVISSGAAFYAASKAAVVSLTKSGALEYGPEGIRVVGIAPGPIDTPMMRAATGNTWPPRIVGDTPLGRLGEAEEVAQAVLWLASEGASYVSGATLAVDGGFLAP